MNKLNTSILMPNYNTMKKCKICKEFISLENNFDKVIFDFKENSPGYVHPSCEKKRMMKKRKLSESDIDILISTMIEETIPHVIGIIYRNQLYQYLREKYRVIQLTESFYQKMEEIFAGNYKEMSRGISPEHLLGMFRRAENSLRKNFRNLSGQDKINYDLAILIKDYPYYLDFLEKMEVVNRNMIEQIAEKKPNIEIIGLNKKLKKQEEENIFSDIEGDD